MARMRHFLALLTVLALAAPLPVLAAEIFVRPNKDNALPEAPYAAPKQQRIQQPPPPQEQGQPEIPQSAPETIEDFAERYNENCLKKKDPIMKGEPLRMLCACSASKLQEKMTVEEVKTMM